MGMAAAIVDARNCGALLTAGYGSVSQLSGSALGSDVEASTYLATAQDARLIPFNWYLAAVIAGALRHEMSDSHAAGLRSTRFVEDAKMDRKTRVAAIKAMRNHGIDDFLMLLGA